MTSRLMSEVAHALGAHRDAVGDRDRVELERLWRPPRGCLRARDRELAQVIVAGTDLGPGVGDADERAAQVRIGEADGLQHGARAGAGRPLRQGRAATNGREIVVSHRPHISQIDGPLGLMTKCFIVRIPPPACFTGVGSASRILLRHSAFFVCPMTPITQIHIEDLIQQTFHRIRHGASSPPSSARRGRRARQTARPAAIEARIRFLVPCRTTRESPT